MTANEVKDVLTKNLFAKGHSPIVTNYQGAGLDECDVLSISKAGLVYEYEIKISRNDFRKEFKDKVFKHQRMAERTMAKNGPGFTTQRGFVYEEDWVTTANYYSFCVPDGLIKLEEVPEYAGLYYIVPGNENPVCVKPPVKLHNIRATPRLLKSISHRLTCMVIFGCSFMHYKHKQSKYERHNTETD